MTAAGELWEGTRYTPEAVAKIVGPATAERLFTLTDLPHRRVRIFEERTLKGAAEWAAANRRRAGGPVIDSRVDGTTILTDAHISLRPGARAPPAFGPAQEGKGGEALDDCFLRGKDVVTRWKGLAGAGLGLASSLGLARGVLEFRAKGLEAVGGDHGVEIEIVSPGLHRLLIGIDDTDSPQGGATWALAKSATEGMEDLAILSLRLIQLYPGVPYKTTNCVGALVEAAVAPWMEEGVKIEVRDRVEALSRSQEPGLVFVEGVVLDGFLEAAAFAQRARREIVTEDDARAAAGALGAQIALDGRGLIGAVAAIGASEMGPEVADVVRTSLA